MSQFKKIVEDQVQQIMHQPEPTVLTDDIKAKVLDAVNKIEPDVEELSTYEYTPARHWNGNFAPDPEEVNYDEDEYYAKQIEEFIDGMKADGIIDMIDIPREKWDDESYLKRLETEIEVWLSTIQPVGTWGGYDEDLYRDDR